MRYIKTSMIAAASLMLLASCNYLDVAPAKKATLKDAMKNKGAVENWIYGCYSALNNEVPLNCNSIESSVDEFSPPDKWTEYIRHNISRGLINSTNMPNTMWKTYFGTIGNVHLFLRELEAQNPPFLTEEEKNLYRAHAHFLKGLFYFRLLNVYGPVPLVYEYTPTSTPKTEFPGRSHYDYCVDFICNELDEAAKGLPAKTDTDKFGAGNQTICAALKSRLLLYAASPLWNGKFPTPDWKNTNYETPGYGMELVSYEFDVTKWERAKKAAQEAIRMAAADGYRLMELGDAEVLANRDMIPATGCWLPGVDVSDPESENTEFAKRVLLMRYVAASNSADGNKELIFTLSHSMSNEAIHGLPRRIVQDGNNTWRGGWSGLSPTLQAVEAFYTRAGKLPAKDKAFTAQENWLKSAGIKDRPEVINLNVGREPRFYAWITYDGCDLGPMLLNGKPYRVNFRSNAKNGYNPADAIRDQCQTGYLTNKWLDPKANWTSSNRSLTSYYAPYIRMAELYLNLAEACAELYMANGNATELQSAIDNLNIIRKRAGVPTLTTADMTADMTIRDWVRAERRIELYMEGHRYHDLRRWLTAPEHLAAGVREGLDSFVGGIENPTMEQFNRRVKVDGAYKWDNKMYLLPVRQQELYSNPQMVQAPGY